MNFNETTQIVRRRFVPNSALVVRLGLGCMLLYSGLAKMRQPYDFLSNVYNFELVGLKLGVLTAIALPWVELLVGICLIGGIFASGALLVSIGMGAMFSFVIGSALYRGLNVSCGCFGATSAEIGYTTLIRACVIMLLSMGAYIATITQQSSLTPAVSEQKLN